MNYQPMGPIFFIRHLKVPTGKSSKFLVKARYHLNNSPGIIAASPGKLFAGNVILKKRMLQLADRPLEWQNFYNTKDLMHH